MKLWVMKLKQWWFKRRYLQVRMLSPKLTDYKASRQALESLLEHLDEKRFVHFTQADAIGTQFGAYYNTIDEYRQQMKQVALQFMNEQMIQTSWADQTERVVKLERFLTSKDGFYLDVVSAIHDFKHEALILCALMEKSEQAQWGVQDHNRRMLLRFFANLRQLTTSLVDVSLTLSPQA